ncbi:predicted protein [Phaeodactylum tricornutum CCAP 1055/1]|uniref:START domain-containing protein n=2 Tax=Phaeodactylum tricornutum TaxID=2850 RepID=B7FSB4_PHATC|nr:predicted protein [Phaeodactylum tricornutum CCAP 1055/1]EEC50447.1 predicted protein [Phaeodactylum tricornutum CCAP 1055/1]|eukprot:XP_002177633.1 predicted protein [Phaeodactylum tricornutum CCAP 1055/1]
MICRYIYATALLFFNTSSVTAFSNALFQETPSQQITAPSKTDGVDIELPDFDELFERIRKISPLANCVIHQQQQGDSNPRRGFAAAESCTEKLRWKTIEERKDRLVHQIQKIDNFQGLPAPLVRFRSSLSGPCVGECFANFIMDIDERKKWDSQIEQVYEAYPIHDLDAANIAMGFGRYGDCSRLGIGYCQTKANLGISPREQLILCGIQNFSDGSCIVWGTEMEEWHNHLFPPGERHTRAKSHIFSTTLTPTSENSFDVEYALQLEVGGKLPTWCTTPILVDTIKKMFIHAQGFFGGEHGNLEAYLSEQKRHNCFPADRQSLLMTP